MTDDGYQLHALIPVSLLKINPAKDEFLLEFQVSVSSGKDRTYHTLFGSQHAYQNSQRFGTFTTRKPTTEQSPDASP